MEIGKKFKEARQKKGLTIDDIQEKTKIRKKYLCALENEEFDVIPGAVYAKAFIKSYAQQLDLDEIEMMEEFQEWVNQQKEIKEEEFKTEKFSYVTFAKRHKRAITVVIIIIFAAAAYNFAFLHDERESSQKIAQNQKIEEKIDAEENETTNSQENISKKEAASAAEVNKLDEIDETEIKNNEESDSEQTEEVLIEESIENNDKSISTEEFSLNNNSIQELEELQKQEQTDQVEYVNIEKSEEQSQEEGQNKEQIDEDMNTTLKIIGSGHSWVRVIMDDEKVFEGFINDGETMTFSGKEKMVMKLGNAVAVTVEKDGEILGPFGKSGAVITKELNF